MCFFGYINNYPTFEKIDTFDDRISQGENLNDILKDIEVKIISRKNIRFLRTMETWYSRDRTRTYRNGHWPVLRETCGRA